VCTPRYTLTTPRRRARPHGWAGWTVTPAGPSLGTRLGHHVLGWLPDGPAAVHAAMDKWVGLHNTSAYFLFPCILIVDQI
jgi:hypothetical protein